MFVHVLDDQGERLWGDDHPPAAADVEMEARAEGASTRGRSSCRTTRTSVRRTSGIGLYSPSASQRLPLCATDVSRREYEVAKFQLLPQSENIFLIYKDGWHPAEVSSQDPTNEWQWTKKAATISFRNPKKDATFYLEFDARTDKFAAPQQVTVRSGDQVIGTFAADSTAPKLVIAAGDGRAARVRGHVRADARRRPDLRRQAAATCASSASACSTPSSRPSSAAGREAQKRAKL